MKKQVRFAGNFSMLLALALVVTAVGGCGGGGSDLDSIPVTGKVTGPDGAPLKGVGISFRGTGSKTYQATGVSGEDGSYELSTGGENDGAPAGDYAISLSDADGKPLKADPATVTVAEGKDNNFDIKATK